MLCHNKSGDLGTKTFSLEWTPLVPAVVLIAQSLSL